jgi:hypothetical protein
MQIGNERILIVTKRVLMEAALAARSASGLRRKASDLGGFSVSGVLVEKSVLSRRLEGQRIRVGTVAGCGLSNWTTGSLFQTRWQLALESLALRQPVGVLLRAHRVDCSPERR